jgi:hypothetical protein
VLEIIRKAADEKIENFIRNDGNGWFDQECADYGREKQKIQKHDTKVFYQSSKKI